MTTRFNRMWEELHAGEEMDLEQMPVDATDLRYALECLAMVMAFVDDDSPPPARMVEDSLDSLDEDVAD